MKKGRKRILSFSLVILLIVNLLLPGCSSINDAETVDTVDDETITLRLLVENIHGNLSAQRQLDKLIRNFEKEHEHVEIVIEELPYTNGDELNIQLDRFGVEIMANKGPDMFLIFTQGNTTPLFPDVNQAMRNGLFADITEYYDADTELNTAGLNTVVMNAGVVDGRRFTLPLRYDFPIVSVIPDAIEAKGLSTDILDGSITELMDAITQLEGTEMASNAHFRLNHHGLNFFPELIDYENQEVLIEKEEMASLLQSWVAFSTAREGEPAWFYSYDLATARCQGHWAQLGECIRISSLDAAIQNAALSKSEGLDIEMYPLTGQDGKIVAEVSCFAAVGAACEYPDLAYDFLREFLTEDSQWEENSRTYFADLFCAGYCVRSENSVASYHQVINSRIQSVSLYAPNNLEKHPEYASFLKRLESVQLTDEDVPILQAEIDVARYPLAELELYLGFELVNAAHTDNFDTDAVAEEFIKKLEWHMFEG